MQDIVKSNLMRKLNSQKIKRSFQKIGCAMDARNWGHMVHCCAQQCRSDQIGQTGHTRPVRPVIPSAAAGPLKKPTRSTLAPKKTTDAQKPKIQVKRTFVKLKYRICYTCRAKGHMSKDCPKW